MNYHWVCLPQLGRKTCETDNDCYQWPLSANQIIGNNPSFHNYLVSEPSSRFWCFHNRCRFEDDTYPVNPYDDQNYLCKCWNNILEISRWEQCDGWENCSSSCQCEPWYEPDPNGNWCIAIQTIECPNASEIVPQLLQWEPWCPWELLATVDEIAWFTAWRYDSNWNTLSEWWSIHIDAPGTYTMHFQLQNTNVSPSLICDYYPTVHINPEDFIMDSMCSVCGDWIENETEQCDWWANCTPSCECPVWYESDPNSNGCNIKPFTPPVFNPLDPTTYVCWQCQSNTDCEAGETCRSSLCIPDLSAPCSNDNAC